MQSLDDKAAAISTILWLTTAHYAMLAAGRLGCCIQYERTPMGLPWRPPIMEEFEGWNVEEIINWCEYQKRISRKYRLYAVGLALEKLEHERPKHATAVKAKYVEIPQPNWYEPERIDDRAAYGLLFMAEDVPGDVPRYDEPVKSKNTQIEELLTEGWGYRTIAFTVGCSRRDIAKVVLAIKERSESTVSARS